ncbi:MAG TPA: hypothetical protein VEB20_06670 [Azospirillaceae bacterium]|nr:hypothetical protein [Azospirillaceae bacterium]
MTQPFPHPEHVLTSFPLGTCARIDAAAGEPGMRDAFIRDAVEQALVRAEAGRGGLPAAGLPEPLARLIARCAGIVRRARAEELVRLDRSLSIAEDRIAARLLADELG